MYQNKLVRLYQFNDNVTSVPFFGHRPLFPPAGGSGFCSLLSLSKYQQRIPDNRIDV